MADLTYHNLLPSVAKASLPAAYSAARTALAKCWRIDECKNWSDKAKALASYAKQSRDDGLAKVAKRIQGRAIRRCGELLEEFEAKHTGRIRAGSGPNSKTRKQAARAAGLSERQQKQALRVARVNGEDFERQVTLCQLKQAASKNMPYYNQTLRSSGCVPACPAKQGTPEVFGILAWISTPGGVRAYPAKKRAKYNTTLRAAIPLLAKASSPLAV